MELRDFWYPVCLSRELRQRPLARKLLGTPLVLFRKPDGSPAALLDSCPHRRAVLSAGKIKEGTIECGYHGWRFAGDGACTKIPGHEDQDKACQGKRALAFAARELHGMIFVYGRSGEPRSEPFAHPHVEDPRFGWMVRSFRCKGSLAMALDNFMDVMHPPFLHPGMLYDDHNRTRVEVTVRKWSVEDQPDQAGVEAVYTGEPSPTRGWVGRILLAGKSYDETHHVERFIAPNIHLNEYAVAENAHLYVTCYNTPEDDEHLRLFMFCVFRFPWPRAVSSLLIDRFLVGPTVRQDVDFFNEQFDRLATPFPELSEQSTVLDTHGLRVRAFMKKLGEVDSMADIEVPETRLVGWM